MFINSIIEIDLLNSYIRILEIHDCLKRWDIQCPNTKTCRKTPSEDWSIKPLPLFSSVIKKYLFVIKRHDLKSRPYRSDIRFGCFPKKNSRPIQNCRYLKIQLTVLSVGTFTRPIFLSFVSSLAGTTIRSAHCRRAAVEEFRRFREPWILRRKTFDIPFTNTIVFRDPTRFASREIALSYGAEGTYRRGEDESPNVERQCRGEAGVWVSSPCGHLSTPELWASASRLSRLFSLFFRATSFAMLRSWLALFGRTLVPNASWASRTNDGMDSPQSPPPWIDTSLTSHST